MDTQLAVQIESEGGALTLTPMGLLEHFLPGAKLVPGSSRIFEGHVPGQPDKKCYVQVEALYGMLMEARERHLNPISSMYLIPSSAADRPAGHKIKYDVGVQRARRIPGFLGMNMGLLVQRGNAIAETSGEVALPGDTVLGAWAEIYITGLLRPLRKEISKKEFAGTSKVWNEKGGFMLCKVAVDHLLRLNYPTLYAEVDSTDSLASDAEESVILESVMPEPAPAPAPHSPESFLAGEWYTGTLTEIIPRVNRKAGRIVLDTAQGLLTCFFFSRPAALKKEELDWTSLVGSPARMSFTEREDKSGKTWRYVQEFTFGVVDAAPASAATGAPEGDPA